MRADRQDGIDLLYLAFGGCFAKVRHSVFFDKGLIIGRGMFMQGVLYHIQHPFFELLPRFVQTRVYSGNGHFQKIGDIFLG
jgi:hypothetical protein